MLTRAAGRVVLLCTDQEVQFLVLRCQSLVLLISVVNKTPMPWAVSTETANTRIGFNGLSSIPADSPTRTVSNQRHQTSQPLKNNSSVLPISGNAVVKKHSVQQDNPLALNTGKTLTCLFLFKNPSVLQMKRCLRNVNVAHVLF